MPSTATAVRRLYLIDAHAYLHRAYHALPPLANSSGEPVGALFGFARLLLGVLKRDKPEFVAVCFDAPGPTFRHEAYADYKATRKDPDADLKSQLALARPLAEELGFKCLARPGYEADDLMATMASRARARGLDVTLITTDKDAFQLVGPNVRVLHEGKGLSFDPAKVREKYGIEPGQIVDYLSLVGDASDNVPGAPGIGPVGAAKLLNRYGTLKALLEVARAEDGGLPAKTARTLRDNEEKLLLSRRLIELDAKVPVDLDVQDCRVVPASPERLLGLLRRFEFKAVIRELFPESADGAPGLAGNVPSPVPGVGDVPGVKSSREDVSAGPDQPPLELKAWLKAAAGAERVSLAFARMPRMELLGDAPWAAALGLPDGRRAWAEARDFRNEALLKLLTGKAEKVGHDLKTAFTALRRSGVEPAGRVFDTMLAAYCVDPAAKYDFTSVRRLYAGGPEEAPAARGPRDPRAAALREVREVWALAAALGERLRAEGLLKLYEELEVPMLDVLSGMEAEGVAVDAEHLKRLGGEFEALIAGLKREIDSLAGAEVNLNSPKQLAKLLFEDLKLPVIHKTRKGGDSTDEETLSALKALHPLPAKIIDYRELTKLLSTYIEGLLERMDPETRRVHTHFNQAGTATGRLSSLDPNLQNIPIRTPMGRKIRRAFVAREGCVLLSADYSQIDLRLLAHLSEDPALVEAFKNGEDVHLRTACEIFDVSPAQVDSEMRRRAKAVNFGIVYGQTAHGLSRELGIPMGKAKEYIDRYFARYAGVARWSKATLEAARREGSVRTLLGRVRRLPDLSAKNTAVRQFNERVAVNTPIQGSSADVIKAAMIRIHREMRSHPGRWKSKLVLQVHDELVFETRRDELREFGRWARREMESAVKLSVPLVVDLKASPNWQDMEKLA